jgi:hypothetical protein
MEAGHIQVVTALKSDFLSSASATSAKRQLEEVRKGTPNKSFEAATDNKLTFYCLNILNGL